MLNVLIFRLADTQLVQTAYSTEKNFVVANEACSSYC